jgi:beta-N-acetylhexosaminidase
MPAIERSWQQLWEEDLLPYRKLNAQLPFVMVSHAAYPLVNDAGGPASVSKYWITEVLRKKIGYRGLILSDDMEMGGVLGQHSIEEASIAAIVAGTDLLEICHQPDLILRSYEALLSEAERSLSFRRKVVRAAAHVRKHRRRLLAHDRVADAASEKEVAEMRSGVERFAAKVNAAEEKRRSR